MIPKEPRCCLYSCSVLPGNLDARKLTGDMLGVRVSTWCWEKYALCIVVLRVLLGA